MDETQEIQSDSWEELLGRHGLTDVYLRQGYVAASCALEPGRPILLCLEDRGGCVAFPLILRDVPGAPGMRDVTTAYGYGGPVGAGPAPPWDAFHQAYERWCERMCVVTTFVRFHPLFANHVHAGPNMSVVPLGGTISWRLGGNREVFAGMHKDHRRLVRKARNEGVEVAVTENPSSLESFRGVYETTMRRRRASSYYFFAESYWDSLLRLRESIVVFEAVLGERVVAAALCLGAPPWLHYHLGATDDAGRSLGASHLVLLEAATWAQARGCTIFHLGGGVGGKPDDLLHFKRRFDYAGLVPSFVGKQIHRLTTYRDLSGSGNSDGFFPAYRAPGSTPNLR